MNIWELGDKLDFRVVAEGMGIAELFSIADMEQRLAAIAGSFLREHPQSPRSPAGPEPMAPMAASLDQATSPKRRIAGAGDAQASQAEVQSQVVVESSIEDASRMSGSGGGGRAVQSLEMTDTSLDSASLATIATPAVDDVAVWKHIIAKWQSTKQVMAQDAQVGKNTCQARHGEGRAGIGHTQAIIRGLIGH